jgi:hypothetical protein
MARRPAALVVALLAFSAQAQAATKAVSVPAPGAGDLSLAQYRLKSAAGAPRAAVPVPAGGAKVVASVAKAKGTTEPGLYDLAVFVARPRHGARARQAAAVSVSVSARRALRSTRLVSAANVLNGRRPSLVALSRYCRNPNARPLIREALVASGLTRAQARPAVPALRRYVCQYGSVTQRLSGVKLIERRLGLDAPDCFGSALALGADYRELTVHLTCSARANQVAFVAQRGNDGAACDGPPDKGCEAGPLCSPFPRESVCFGGFSAFDAATTYTFGATWSRNVPLLDGVPLISGRYVPFHAAVQRPALIAGH